MKTRTKCLHDIVCAVVCMVVCAMAPVQSIAQTISSWSATPDPTGNPKCLPVPTKLLLDVTFTVDKLSDNDTETKITSSGGSCIPASKEWPDRIDGDWDIIQTGDLTGKVYPGHTVNAIPVAWPWSSNGGTGASATIVGLFTFDDRWPATDPKHDRKYLGGTSSIILIPDSITSSFLSDNYDEYDPNIHIGAVFEEHIVNEAYPTFTFAGYNIKEEVLLVLFNVQDDDAIREEIIESATKDKDLLAVPYFNDKHGMPPSKFTNGNTTITLLQIYKIGNKGWPEKNPAHRIGAGTGIFSGVHMIVYTKHSDTYVAAEKGDF